MQTNLYLAFGLTLFAGLSTGIGSALAFFTKRTDPRVLSLALGTSAGVMIYVSFVELLDQSRTILSQTYGDVAGAWLASGGFFGGIALIAIIDRLVPGYENPHEIRSVEQMTPQAEKPDLMRMGVMAALAIGIHNFPEGLAAFISTLSDPTVGVTVTIAIAIHNIPEGIAVAVPIYYATGNRKKAFWLSFLSGLSEPVGALVGFLVLRPFLTPGTFGLLFAIVAGIMVFVSLDELFPAAREYGKPHWAIYGLVAGMAVMAMSLLLLH